MKNFSTWLLVMFMGLFWIFRIFVMLSAQMNWGFSVVPLNQEMEILLLFIVLACMILVIKRKIIGALLYLLSYGMYFGIDLLNNMQNIFNVVESGMDINNYLNLFVSFIGMIIPIAVLFDLLLDRGRKNSPKDKKTDWFYQNEQFDRKLDERADKNNYRTL